jgi:periplasmic protein TonB
MVFTSARSHPRFGWLWAVASSFVFHGLLIALADRLLAFGVSDRAPREIEIEVVETVPPPQLDVAPPPPRESPPPALPTPLRRFHPRSSPGPRERSQAPAPPQNLAPVKEVSPPTFGVAQASVVAGDSAVAVPIGDSLAGKQGSGGQTAPHGSSLGGGTFQPEASDQIATEPEFELDAVYPAQAERDAIEGKVLLEVEVDREGRVRSVRVLSTPGYGMEESAVSAMWKARVKPARSRGGLAVDCRVKHTVHFRPATSEPEESP